MIETNKSPFFAAILLALAGLALSMGVHAKGPGGTPTGDLTVAETHHVLYMREEEKLARDTYRLLNVKYDLAVFENIASSEQSHMDSMKGLVENYDLTDPVDDESTWNDPDNLFSYADSLNDLITYLLERGSLSRQEAITVGVIIEETDILDIQHAIEQSGKTDVINVFTNLMCGSRNHLRAFVRVYEALYGPYERPAEESFLPDWEFDMIAYSDKEDCGGTKRNGRP